MQELTDLIKYLENRGFMLSGVDKRMIELTVKVAFVLGEKSAIEKSQKDIKECMESVCCGG